MKAIICEMCQSNEFVKQEGMYVCQYCGTKYTVEEARKLMVEGTVKIDNSDLVDKYLQNAHRARAKQDWAETEKYYNLVEANQPENWEAVFYSAYAKVMNLQTDMPHILPALDVLIHSMDQVIFQVEKLPNDEEIVQLQKFSSEINEMARIINENARNASSSDQTTLSHEIRARGSIAKVHFAFADTLEERIEKYDEALHIIGENYKRGCEYLVRPFAVNYEYLNQHNDRSAYETADKNNAALMNQYFIKAQKYDPSFVQPSQPTAGCYVATAVYGSYNCPEVWTLRRFRDNTLATTWYGRAFIYTYYAISPTIVKWFGDTDWFKNMWKPTLDRMVANLNADGVENTPYRDKVW